MRCGLLLAAVLVGCGVKAPPRPPERAAGEGVDPSAIGTTAAPIPAPSGTPSAPTPPRP